jgi:membrane-associated phospholipid phosphatase
LIATVCAFAALRATPLVDRQTDPTDRTTGTAARDGAPRAAGIGGRRGTVTPTNPGVSGVGGRSLRLTDRLQRPRADDVELIVACALLAAVGLAGLYFMVRPGPTWFDRFVFSLITPRPRSQYVIAVSRLGSAPVLAVGALAGFVATIRRDRARAAALLAGPLCAVIGTDVIVKPVVGRTFHGVLSFPSGSVAAVAALGTVAVLATPDRWRWGAGVAGGTVTVLMAVAVIGLGWHYPTDTLGGLALGSGAVLLLDCVARRIYVGWLAGDRAGAAGGDAAPEAHNGRAPNMGDGAGAHGGPSRVHAGAPLSEAEAVARR